MYGLYNKKNLNLIILRILWEHTDERHRLQQQDIVHLVQTEYGMEIDRRSVKNNVDALKDMFADTRIEISTEGGYCLLARDFDDAELRMLIDGVLFSKTVSQRQAKELIGKLKGLSSKYFGAKVSHISNLPELRHTDNKQIMYNIDVINDAISSNRKISFTYNRYGTDFKLHPRREQAYIVNPYQMAAANGFYYLIGNYDKYDDISHYRVDKMTEVRMLDAKAKSKKDIPEMEDGFSLPKHMAEHIYMYAGPSVPVILKTDTIMMDELVDWFGRDFRILAEKDGMVTVRVNCNEKAMFYWALQYGTCVEVVEPASLRAEISEAAEELAKKYRKQSEADI